MKRTRETYETTDAHETTGARETDKTHDIPEYRDFNVYKGTRSQSPILTQPIESKKRKTKQWVSATKTYNAMMNNHLIDWLELYGKGMLEQTDDQFIKYLRKSGQEFEEHIFSRIKLFKYSMETISQYYTNENVHKTIAAMKKGIHIITSAPLANSKNNTYGIADILIRSDIIEHIFTNFSSDQNKYQPAKKLDLPYHYRVIDVKYATVPLSSDKSFILNQGKFPAYKAQLAVYNMALGDIQGYEPETSYIIGRKYTWYKSSQKFLEQSSLGTLGSINYTTNDHDVIEKTKAAIKWYRSVQNLGTKWTIDPPSHKNLYPNMKVDSGKWNTVKLKIAQKIGEITLLWNVSLAQRLTSHSNGIKSFMDLDCTAKSLNVPDKNRELIDQFIKVNRDNYDILPQKIENSVMTVPKPNEFYLDFETFSDICIKNTTQDTNFTMIFMIGIGWLENSVWNYTQFIADSATYAAEKTIINRFLQFINKYNDPTLIYWKADQQIWSSALERHSIEDQDDSVSASLNWYDLMSLFQNEKIVVNGCYDFGLKNIAREMKRLNMINTTLEADCSNGMLAMIRAWECYDKYKTPIQAPIMKDIARYNQYDCKVMCDILMYLRQNILS